MARSVSSLQLRSGSSDRIGDLPGHVRAGRLQHDSVPTSGPPCIAFSTNPMSLGGSTIIVLLRLLRVFLRVPEPAGQGR